MLLLKSTGAPSSGLFVLGLCLTACAQSPAASPDASGSISGKIVFEGRAPQMRPLPIEADPGCKALHVDKPLLSEFLILGEGQSVANVLVHVVSGLPQGKTYPVPTEAVEVSQKDCRYGPHVVALRAGQTLRFVNPDGLQHNVHPLPKVNREVNRAMSKTEPEFTHTFPQPEAVFRIKCDVHAWMEAWCAVFDHPYFAVTKDDGAFTIPNLPPGEYEIEAWHEALGTQRAKVTVTAAAPATATANFTFTRPQKKP
jgi:plastocyanin